MISVIVPVYNVENYLNECVESICAQSYTDMEIILVDDGSTDGCPALCDEWAHEDSRVKVIHKPNGGLSDARNVGIDIAKGEYISFVDSDDMIAPDMVEYLVKLIENSDSVISVCQRLLIDENGKKYACNPPKIKESVIKGRGNCMRTFLESSDIDTVAWGKLYKTSLFKNVRYPKGKFHEDVFTTYKLIAQCESIAIGWERKYFYRVRTGSITQISFTEKHLDAINGKEDQYEFISREFPRLKISAEGGIIYACNQCLLRLSRSNADYTPFIDDFKIKYHKHIKSYLNGRYKLIGKLFAIVCWINPMLVLKSIRIIKRIK